MFDRRTLWLDRVLAKRRQRRAKGEGRAIATTALYLVRVLPVVPALSRGSAGRQQRRGQQ
jgi:hypothetical protein